MGIISGTVDLKIDPAVGGDLHIRQDGGGQVYVEGYEIPLLAKALIEKHFGLRVVRRITVELERLEPQFEEVEL